MVVWIVPWVLVALVLPRARVPYVLLVGWRVLWWSVGVGVVGVGAGRGLCLGGRRFRACHSWLAVAVLVTVLARAPPVELRPMWALRVLPWWMVVF